ncbi:sugar O-acetyltransferase [Bacteroidales bacterium OttesenSCG-928-J19]|nr:sugar O-acetyltransferase [Bacteroidales bacterium OttesenSCG-928-J19]
MTEKEKMLAGEPYDAGDPELLERWYLAKELVSQYNTANPRDQGLLDSLLDRLLGSRGKRTWITAPFFVDYGENIHLGEGVELNMNCVFLDCNTITIGDYSGIGPGVHIYAVGHPIEPEARLNRSEDGSFSFWTGITAPVTIGRNVWIGGGSIILPGVTIGDNTTIGAGSVVTKSIPANVLAVGNPCRVVRTVNSEQ